ncbi:MAG: redoxin domain-containing protein [Chloroflexi bacterium]|nr:redoxin domain-containing protein [Chloroflexota bacterium]
MVELQRNLETLNRNGIRAFAISPDSQAVLRKFAQKYEITYPLLSDEGSHVIRAFGILNTNIPEDHEWYGVPYPGVYAVGRDGRVFDKSFIANHRIRESVNDLLQGSFRVADLERGEAQVVTTPHLAARAYFASPTIRKGQLTTLTVDISLADGLHIYGRPLPEGHIPVELTLDENEALSLRQVVYPEPEGVEVEALGERLPAYTGGLAIRAQCLGGSRDGEGNIQVTARLRYQACDDRECFLPETLTFILPLHFLPHDWELIT